MRKFKMFSVTIATAISLAASLGVGSTSATVLCKDAACTEPYPAGTEIDASLTGSESMKLEAGATVLFECSKGTIKGTTTNAGSSTETVKETIAKANVTWGDCTKTLDMLAGGEFEFHWSSGTNGTLTAKGLEITINTIFGSCVLGYGNTPKDLGAVIGGSPATIAISTSLPKISGLCPSESTWTANYTFTSPTPLYEGSTWH